MDLYRIVSKIGKRKHKTINKKITKIVQEALNIIV